jgi:RhtB (resistance to homoserine/threonine) family protein
MDLHTLITCFIAVTILTLTPGVDTMLVIRNSARGGWRDGAVSSLGICSGLFIHATVSALGISIILLQTAWAFNLIKYAGAAYLVWLGICSWKQVISPDKNLLNHTPTIKDHFAFTRSLREGFLSNVLNPKTVIFYMAFLPQFIDPTEPPLIQSLMVATLHFLVAMVYQCSLAGMVDKAQVWLQRPDVKRVFDSLTGTILLLIGLRLAAEK